MEAPLDELYFSWLYVQVGGSKSENPNRTYWRMLKTLYTKEFVWIIPNDDNRIADGTDLRYEFVDQSGLNDVDLGWVQLPCSMLELLIGLSRRLAFQEEREPEDWFWELIENIGLSSYKDSRRSRNRNYPEQAINEILDRIIWRTYDFDGHGGLFPLKEAHEDQRKVELWYQLCAYILERM